MDSPFSPFVIEALVNTVSGGPGLGSTEEPIGHYRSMSEIDGFLMSCGIRPADGGGSRLPKLRESLSRAIERENGFDLIRRCIESIADPRGYAGKPEKAAAVLDCINTSLRGDGYEVITANGRAALRKIGSSGAMVHELSEKSVTLDFDTVNHEVDRALKGVEDDPEDCVTAACALIESVCRSVLIELSLPLPPKKDLTGLVSAVQNALDLSPGRSGLPAEIETDVRQILGGLTTVAKGMVHCERMGVMLTAARKASSALMPELPGSLSTQRVRSPCFLSRPGSADSDVHCRTARRHEPRSSTK